EEALLLPDALLAQARHHLAVQQGIAEYRAGLEQGCGDRDIARRGVDVLPDGAHALANFKIDVPEEGQEGLDVGLVGLEVVTLQQDLDVDVGVGVQLAAAITANGHEADVGGVLPAMAAPDLSEDLVDEPAVVADQVGRGFTCLEARVELLAGLADALLEQRDGSAAFAQPSGKIAGIERQ